jgi:hypothetical protein
MLAKLKEYSQVYHFSNIFPAVILSAAQALTGCRKTRKNHFVILSAAKNLVFSIRYRSFTSFRMTAKTIFNSLLDFSVAALLQHDRAGNYYWELLYFSRYEVQVTVFWRCKARRWPAMRLIVSTAAENPMAKYI